MKKSMIKQCILSLLCLLWAGQTVLAGELRERVYLQTDKQFYLSGELVWMKFIATDLDQRLSDVSKVGYVELLDSASAVVQARLVLEKGVYLRRYRRGVQPPGADLPHQCRCPGQRR